MAGNYTKEEQKLAQDKNASIKVYRLVQILKIIDIATSRGVFLANEMYDIGEVYNSISAGIDHYMLLARAEIMKDRLEDVDDTELSDPVKVRSIRKQAEINRQQQQQHQQQQHQQQQQRQRSGQRPETRARPRDSDRQRLEEDQRQQDLADQRQHELELEEQRQRELEEQRQQDLEQRRQWDLEQQRKQELEEQTQQKAQAYNQMRNIIIPNEVEELKSVQTRHSEPKHEKPQYSNILGSIPGQVHQPPMMPEWLIAKSTEELKGQAVPQHPGGGIASVPGLQSIPVDQVRAGKNVVDLNARFDMMSQAYSGSGPGSAPPPPIFNRKPARKIQLDADNTQHPVAGTQHPVAGTQQQQPVARQQPVSRPQRPDEEESEEEDIPTIS